MPRRSLERAFSQAQYKGKARQAVRRKIPPPPPKPETASSEAVIEKIISAANAKDYLQVLGLPLPSVDELGLPVWPYTASHITKSYRQMCLLVHPDKNAGDRARQAFHLLNKAYQALLNEDQRNEILKEASGVALAAEERREAQASVDEKIKINANKIQQKRKLTKLQHESFQSEILRQVKERQQHQSMKRQKLAESRYTAHTEAAATNPDLTPEPPESTKPDPQSLTLHPTLSKRLKSEKQRIKDRLKSKEAPEEAVDDAPVEESHDWEAAILTKQRRSRHKPRFLI